MGLLSKIGFLAALAALVWIAGPVLGFRYGVNDFSMVMNNFGVLRESLGKFLIIGAVLFGLVVGILSLISGRSFIGLLTVAIALAGGASIYYGPISMAKAGASVPPIHDISTDTNTPPLFVDILALRADAPNPASYDTEQTAQQLEAFPDIQTILVSGKSYDEVFSAAQAALQSMDVKIIAASKEDGRLEAVWTSKAFGFKDDVVVRILPEDQNVFFVDIRSKSRFGRSDLGENAKRIRVFMAAFNERIGGA